MKRKQKKVFHQISKLVEKVGLRLVFQPTSHCLVSYAAALCLVTQRSSPRALRDETKNGCVGDYSLFGYLMKHSSSCLVYYINGAVLNIA